MDSGPSPFTSTLAQLWEERKRVELPARGTQDQVVWSKEASGEFSMGLLGMLSYAEAIQLNGLMLFFRKKYDIPKEACCAWRVMNVVRLLM